MNSNDKNHENAPETVREWVFNACNELSCCDIEPSLSLLLSDYGFHESVSRINKYLNEWRYHNLAGRQQSSTSMPDATRQYVDDMNEILWAKCYKDIERNFAIEKEELIHRIEFLEKELENALRTNEDRDDLLMKIGRL